MVKNCTVHSKQKTKLHIILAIFEKQTSPNIE